MKRYYCNQCDATWTFDDHGPVVCPACKKDISHFELVPPKNEYGEESLD